MYFKCKMYTNFERDILDTMEETKTQLEPASEQHDGVQSKQTDVAKAHHYDVSKYERPSVTVDVVMMSLRQRDLQVLLVKRRSWPYEGMWAIPSGCR